MQKTKFESGSIGCISLQKIRLLRPVSGPAGPDFGEEIKKCRFSGFSDAGFLFGHYTAVIVVMQHVTITYCQELFPKIFEHAHLIRFAPLSARRSIRSRDDL